MGIFDDVDGAIFAVGAKDLDAFPDVGDDVAFLTATNPGEDGSFGVLDYMSVVAWGTLAVPAEDATEVTVDFGVGHMGLATPEADIGDIPAEREAHYSGDFVGIVVESGEGSDGFVAVAINGDADFTAFFDEGTVEGGVFDIAIFGTDLDGFIGGSENAGDILFDDVTIAGNTFSGGVVPGVEGFGLFDEGSTGTLDGVFYGPVSDIDPGHMGPAEAGVVLTLYDANPESDAFITGVIGATIEVDD